MSHSQENIVADRVTASGEGDFIPDGIPDRLQDDNLIVYFRMRFEERESYLSSLSREEAQRSGNKPKIQSNRIEQELTRIEQLRSRFASTPENATAITGSMLPELGGRTMRISLAKTI